MPTKTMEVKEKVIPPAAIATDTFPERLRQGQIYSTRNTAQRRGLAQD